MCVIEKINQKNANEDQGKKIINFLKISFIAAKLGICVNQCVNHKNKRELQMTVTPFKSTTYIVGPLGIEPSSY